jgi:hypothetical protein
MYRNGGIVEFCGETGGSFWQGLVDQYMAGGEWWPLKANESVWMVPGTFAVDKRDNPG